MWNIPTQQRLSQISKLYETENIPLIDKLIYLHSFPSLMDMTAQCVHCVLRRIQWETGIVDPSKEMEIMEAALQEIARGFKPGVNSAASATRVHKLVYDMLGHDPYVELKKHSTKVSLLLYPRARAYVRAADDQFRSHNVAYASRRRPWGSRDSVHIRRRRCHRHGPDSLFLRSDESDCRLR